MKQLLKELLRELDACAEGVQWVNDKTLEEAWAICHRGDWMLWLYAKLYPDNIRKITLAKGHCANTVRHLMKDPRSTDAVDAAIAFGEGRITTEELTHYAGDAKKAANAAYECARKGNDPYGAGAYAAYTAYTATIYTDVDYADATAANAADIYAAYTITRKQNRQLTAELCRKYLTL